MTLRRDESGFVELSPEQQLIGLIRGLETEVRICIEVQHGSVTRVVCEGELLNDGCRGDCLATQTVTKAEADLLQKISLVDYGRIRLLAKDGEIVNFEECSWSRLLRPEKIHHQRLEDHFRYLRGGSKISP